MRRLKAISAFASFIIYIVVAALLHFFVLIIQPSRRWHVMSLASCLLIRVLHRILGLKITLKGHVETLKEKGNFIISRHIGYLDGLVLGGLMPCILLSKQEITQWPMIGQVVTISGTVFVDRVNKRRVSGCLIRVMSLLQSGINVVVFPEGTSTDGTHIKPFQTVFFQPPIVAQAAIVPVTISYRSLDGQRIDRSNSENICWYGQVKFFDHLWNLFKFRMIEIEVIVHEKIYTDIFEDSSQDRKRLGALCSQIIAEASGISVNGEANGVNGKNGFYKENLSLAAAEKE